MRLALPFFALLPSLAFAQDSPVAGLVQALNQAGLTSLVQAATTVGNTPVGQSLLANLTSGDPYLVFAPNNAAFSRAPSNITDDPDILTSVIGYHIVPGNFTNATSTYPNVTLAQTKLNDPNFVFLEGTGRPQVVAWATRGDGKTHVLNQRNDSTVVQTASYGNVTLWIVDNVLNIPENLASTIPTNNDSLREFGQLLRSAQLAYYNSTTNQTSDITFFDAFNEGYRGFTLFSPNNDAVNEASSQINSFRNNRTAFNAVLFNSFINGSTIYSPLLAGSQSYVTANGETLTFSSNSTGKYVTSQNTTARIVQPDVLLPNGVVHIIDRFLVNTESNNDAKNSAAQSATSAATASQASQTAPIGFSVTQSLGTAVASPTASGNAATSVFGLTTSNVLSIGVAFIATLFGSFVTVL